MVIARFSGSETEISQSNAEFQIVSRTLWLQHLYKNINFLPGSSGPLSGPHLLTHLNPLSFKTSTIASSTASSHSALVAASIVRCNKDHGAMLVTAATAEITYQFYNTDGFLIDDYTMAEELCLLGYQDDSFRFIRQLDAENFIQPLLKPHLFLEFDFEEH